MFEAKREAQHKETLPQHMPALLRYAQHLTRNSDQAQDLLQETMIKALQNESRVTASAYPARYLAMMMRNINITRYRKTAREPLTCQSEEISLPSRDAPACARETCREVVSALDALTREHREILELTAFDGLSYRELAVRLDIPIGTVMSRLHRARISLRIVMSINETELVCDVFR